ncbi:MAG: orotidine-5'-phosphate decarboxylase [Deltaproteobacteria bacterium]
MDLLPKDRIIFALDVSDEASAIELSRLLKGRVGLFKIGLELFVSCGPSVVERVRKESDGTGIFLDLKFHDIPATVAGAMRSASALGAQFVTVHCDEGGELLRQAVKSAGSAKVLGVTVLTSLSSEALIEAGIDQRFEDPLALVMHRATIAKKAGCAGVVCSGREAGFVRREFGPDFIVVTPGIRSEGDPVGDQKRVVTPFEAVKRGADYIVVGRPIRDAADPVVAAKLIEAEIERGLKERATF